MGITWLQPAALPNKQMALGKAVCREKWKWRHGFLMAHAKMDQLDKVPWKKVALDVMCNVLVT